MAVLYSNNASSALSASITNSATSFSVTAGHGAKFPAITNSDYFYATLVSTGGAIEIVKVTARSTDTFTVVRGQDGTTGTAFTAGDKVELRVTKSMLDDFKTDTRTGYLPLSGGTLTGAITQTNGMTAWGTTTPGTGVGNYHIGVGSSTSNSGGAITFGARDATNGTTAQAGIYITSDGTYGTRMYLATTDSYATGAKTAISISELGNVGITRGALQISGAGITSPNGTTVVAADSAMPSAASSLLYTLAYGPSTNDGHILGMTWSGGNSVYGAQLWIDTDPTRSMAFRQRSNAGVWNSWNYLVHDGNIGSYMASATGHTRASLSAADSVTNLTTGNFRTKMFGSTTSGYNISTGRWESTPSVLSGLGSYGTMIAWSGSDTHGFLALDYSGANAKIGGGNGDSVNWSATLIHSSNYNSYAVARTSTNRNGVTKLYRNDDDSGYNVQTTWSADRSGYWSLRGYNGDAYHAACYVAYSGYADSAGSATNAGTATSVNGGTARISGITGTDQMIENNYGAYLHIGGWGVGRTDATAVLVNTAYRADYADSAGNAGYAGYAGSAGSSSNASYAGYAGTAGYAGGSTATFNSVGSYSFLTCIQTGPRAGGNTQQGSGLRFTATRVSALTSTLVSGTNFGASMDATVVAQGTWRFMTEAPNETTLYPGGIWLRVS